MMTEVINADTTSMFFLVFLGSTPVEIAKSSPPTDSAFKSQAHLIAVGIRPTTTTVIHKTFVKLGRDKLPNDQWANCDNCASVAKYCIVETIAPQMNVIAIPTRIYDSAEIDLMFPN